MRLLVVEDEDELRETIAEGLRLSSYVVDTAADGLVAEELFFAESYDLILLDINLPGQDGFSLLKTIREEDKRVNVILLTARTQVEDRVRGLDLGANDYLVKPFYFEELEARIRSLLRREQILADQVITASGLAFDTKARKASVQGQQIKLTGRETDILEYLLLNRGRPISQEELMSHVWGDDLDEMSNTVRVHISALRSKLRKALGFNLIQNLIGRGYLIEKD